MDHLLLPTGAYLAEDDIVPCIADRDYIGVAFKDYALRTGFTHAIPEFQDTNFSMFETFHPTQLPKLEKFVQTWSFFGVLQEILGAEYDHNDFVTTREFEGRETHILNTSKLPGLLKAAFSRPRSIEEKDVYTAHVSECLNLAEQVTKTFNRINLRIALSVALLFGIIHNIADTSQAIELQVAFTGTERFFGDFLTTRLVSNGWCVNEARFLLRRFGDIACLWFVSYLRRQYTVQDHSSCKEGNCAALQIDPTNYEARHRFPECTCGLVPIDEDLLNEILENGKLPLLDINTSPETEEVTITLVSSDGNQQYVAFSHIWADGLGNPNANALHNCQIKQLRGLASEVLEAASVEQQNNPSVPLIWLDTLCCPVRSGQGKTIAMGKMRKVYEEATHVLVLDDTVRSQCYGKALSIDALVAIFVAPWNRRLWCLQEGALSRSLWFQFGDRAVKLAEVFETLRTFFQSGDPTLRAFALDLGGHYRRLRGFFDSSVDVDDRTLAQIVRAVAERSVSVPSDEPLCLATMFDFDVESIAKEGNSDMRMAKWWQMMCNANLVPSSVIFVPVPRLGIAGYHWAPDSLVTHKIMPKFDGDAAKIDGRGLRVRYAGLKISVAKSRGHDVQRLMPPSEPLLLRDTHTGEWYRCTLSFGRRPGLEEHHYTQFKPAHINQNSLYDIVAESSSALIRSTETFVINEGTKLEPGDTVLFVGMKETLHDCHYVGIHCMAWFSRLGETENSFMQHAYQIGQSMRIHEVSLDFAQEQQLYANVYEAEKSASYLAASKAVSDLLISKLGQLIEDQKFLERLAHRFPNSQLGVAWMVGSIWSVYFDGYLNIDEWYPAHTLWCVD